MTEIEAGDEFSFVYDKSRIGQSGNRVRAQTSILDANRRVLSDEKLKDLYPR